MSRIAPRGAAGPAKAAKKERPVPQAPEAAGAELVAIGEIARPHGVRGELKIKLYNPSSELLLDVDRVVLEHTDGDREVAEIATARPIAEGVLLRLVGCEDRDEADALRGTKLLVPREAFPPLEEGEFYVTDLEGAVVVDPAGDFGRVETLLSYPSCDVLVVTTPEGRVEIPLVEAFVVRVDTAGKRVEIRDRSILVAE